MAERAAPARMLVDTSAILNGEMARQILSGSARGAELLVPQPALDELRGRASQGPGRGTAGLEAARSLAEAARERGVRVSVAGGIPEQDGMVTRARASAMISGLARQNGAILYTSDRVQHIAAQAAGMGAVFLASPPKRGGTEFLRYFDGTTMSVHLKEGQPAEAKRGMPGSFELVRVSDGPLAKKYLEDTCAGILDACSGPPELSGAGATVVQLGGYRIAMTGPPLSESLEVTIVHPTAKMSLSDYEMPDGLEARLGTKAEGIIISGPPGSGKSTFASALANFYHEKRRIVKTLESPRDLQVDAGITQYGRLDGSFENTADILLLVRPDYTVFDEVRRKEDFGTFADLRMTGVGMVGVVHASGPLDAIQRFIGKVELGIIPSVVDTVIFVQGGRVAKAYGLELKVKVPSGMTESDLARPVIEVRDFEGGALEHEIYTFGEENVIVPVSGGRKGGVDALAEQRIKEAFARYDPQAQVEVLSASSARVIIAQHKVASVIGRGGSNIGTMEKELGMRLDIVPKKHGGGELPFELSESRTAIFLDVGRQHAGMHADIYAGGRVVSSSRIGRKGQIRVPRRSEAARDLAESADTKGDIRVMLRED